MARIRTIKPEFAFNEELYDLEIETGLPIRISFALLPSQCCREGRFKWNPRRLKVQILPYDDIDFSRVLDALWTRGFLEKYEENGCVFGVIPSFLNHQVINGKEKASELPIPNENNILTRDDRVLDARTTRNAGKGREGKGKKGDKKTVDKSTDIELPDWLDLTAWNEFVEHRKEKKDKLTSGAIKKNLKVLEENKDRQAEIIDTAIRSGWRGLFPPRGNAQSDPIDLSSQLKGAL
jgi:hypothetical protein